MPQIIEMMEQSQYSLPEIKGALLSVNWPDTLPFERETIHHEGLTITFAQLSNFFDLTTGDDWQATEWMRLKLLQVVDVLLAEYAADIAANEAQRDYLADLNKSIEEGTHV